MAAYLSGAASNTARDPYWIKLRNVQWSDMKSGYDGLGALYNAFNGKYVNLNLSSLEGDVPSSGRDYPSSRSDKNKLVKVILFLDNVQS